MADLIRTHGCGVAVEPANAGAMADSLCYLADHPEECRKMGQQGRLLAESEFRRDRLASTWIDLLEQVYAKTSSTSTETAKRVG